MTPPPQQEHLDRPRGVADGLRKSAIVLLGLGEPRASEMLRLLPPDAARSVREEMDRVRAPGGISTEVRDGALSEFSQAVADARSDAVTGAPSGAETVAQVLDRSLSRPSNPSDAPTHRDIVGDSAPASQAGRSRPSVDDSSASDTSESPPQPFAAFQEAETDSLFDTLEDEHPQTIALVLAYLPAVKAAELLNRLEPHKKIAVVKRIAGIEHTRAEVVEQVERSLRERLRAVMGRTIRSAGVSAVAEILNSTAREVEAAILSDLEAEAPDLADQVRRAQAILDDLLGASDDDLRAVIEQLDDATISLALRTAGDQLRRKVLWVLPPEQAEAIEREVNDLSPVPVREIEAAQQRVAEVVHRLEAAGEIDLVTPASTAASAARMSSMSVLSGESSDEGDAERV